MLMVIVIRYFGNKVSCSKRRRSYTKANKRQRKRLSSSNPYVCFKNMDSNFIQPCQRLWTCSFPIHPQLLSEIKTSFTNQFRRREINIKLLVKSFSLLSPHWSYYNNSSQYNNNTCGWHILLIYYYLLAPSSPSLLQVLQLWSKW